MQSIAAPLRLALVLEQFDPHAGGLEHWTCCLAEALVQRGHEVHVVAARFAAGDLAVVRHSFSCDPSPDTQARQIEAAIHGQRFDIVHDMGYGWSGDVFQPHTGSRVLNLQRDLAAMPIPARMRKLLSPRFRNWRRALRATEHRQMRSAGCVLAVSELVKSELTRMHDLAPSRIQVVPNGVDTERCSPAHRDAKRAASRRALGLADDEVAFLTVAHNFRLKGVDTALQAIELLARRHAKIRLLVAGDGAVADYRRKAARLGIAERVSFLGRVDAIDGLYAAADVLVHATHHDACSLVTLEALAVGLPVITTRVNGAAELLGNAGLVIATPSDVRALTHAIEVMLDPDRRRAMTDAARRLAPALSFENNVARIVEVYQTVLRSV
jgi:UDP-glucose:(heptosyl)LPS alpha-1,3-glucosyltransferase